MPMRRVFESLHASACYEFCDKYPDGNFIIRKNWGSGCWEVFDVENQKPNRRLRDMVNHG